MYVICFFKDVFFSLEKLISLNFIKVEKFYNDEWAKNTAIVSPNVQSNLPMLQPFLPGVNNFLITSNNNNDNDNNIKPNSANVNMKGK